jgi:hypothetical protein
MRNELDNFIMMYSEELVNMARGLFRGEKYLL